MTWGDGGQIPSVTFVDNHPTRNENQKEFQGGILLLARAIECTIHEMERLLGRNLTPQEIRLLLLAESLRGDAENCDSKPANDSASATGFAA